VETRRGQMRALGGEVAKIAAPVLGKRGFGSAQLITEWASVVGAEWADKITPERLAFPPGERRNGTLRVRVASGFAPEIQHRAPQLLERINGFFGYGAVARLVLVQGPPLRPPRPTARPPRPLDQRERGALDRRLDGIDDPALRDALRRLGEAVIGAARRR
jgi:hypothetical protein